MTKKGKRTHAQIIDDIKEIHSKENELLDIEYDQIVRMQKRDQLPLFDKLDVS